MFDLDSYRERRRYAKGFALVLLFIISGVASCAELKYSLWGENVDAVVRRTVIDRDRLVIKYHFEAADGEWHEGSSRVKPSDWSGRQGQTVEVVYLPGSPTTSTMVSVRSPVFPIIFGVMLAAIIAWCAYAYSEAKKGRIVGGEV